MRIPSITLIALGLVTGPLLANSGEQAVLAGQRRWIESYNQRDGKALTAIEADEFQLTFGDGKIQRRADQLSMLQSPLPPGAEYEIVIESTVVHVYGKAAVVTGVAAERGKRPSQQGGSQPFVQRSRYTGTWIQRNGRWQVVASHLSDLKE